MSIHENDDNNSSPEQIENKYVIIKNNQIRLNLESESISKDENVIQSNDSINSNKYNIDDISMNSMNERKLEYDDIHTNINNVNKSKEISNEPQIN